MIVALAGWLGALMPMPFTTIARGEHSRVDEPREAVARTAAEWSALWKQHAGSVDPPAVDFARSMVVAVFLGSRPTAGYSVEIVRIEQQADAIVVTWRERRPGRDAIVAQVLTQPFDIVRTDLRASAVRFEHAR